VSASGFVTAAGTHLLLNGQPYKFAGLNYFQANVTAAIPCWGGNANANLDAQLAAMGPGRMLRAWFFQNEATTNGTRDWAAFDHTLAVAKAHGFKVIATLANQWDSCGEGPYKTLAWYQGGYKTTVEPGDTVPYRAWVQEVVARYKADPTVAFWELVNEPEDAPTSANCSASDETAGEPVMYSFAADVSGLIHSIDPNHLVSLGGGGNGNCGTRYTDYAKVMAIPTLDLCSVHDYWGATVPLSTDPSNGIQLRIDECDALGKPIYTGESGIRVQDVPSLQARASDFQAKISAQLGAGEVGFVAWNWWATTPNTDYQIGPGDPTLPVLTP
jgi:mannan endo-1,4-beta-mannosidase